MYVCIYVCIYIHIYICIYTYIHIYIHIGLTLVRVNSRLKHTKNTINEPEVKEQETQQKWVM